MFRATYLCGYHCFLRVFARSRRETDYRDLVALPLSFLSDGFFRFQKFEEQMHCSSKKLSHATGQFVVNSGLPITFVRNADEILALFGMREQISFGALALFRPVSKE